MQEFTTKEEAPQQFTSGAIRSESTGKGRYNLISPFAYHRIASIFAQKKVTVEFDTACLRPVDSAISNLQAFRSYNGRINIEDHLAIAAGYLLEAIQIEEKKQPHSPLYACDGHGYISIPPQGLHRLALVYERGAAMRGVRNWEKGFELDRCVDSALRHLFQWVGGCRAEDHLGQAIWNLCGVMHFQAMIERGVLPKELDDIPRYVCNSAEEKSNG